LADLSQKLPAQAVNMLFRHSSTFEGKPDASFRPKYVVFLAFLNTSPAEFKILWGNSLRMSYNNDPAADL